MKRPIDDARLTELNSGRRPTATLMEVISIDQQALLAAVVPNLKEHATRLASPRLLRRMETGGHLLWNEFGDDLWPTSDGWKSDIARGWAAMAVGLVPGLSLGQRSSKVQKFAGDAHWAVREWAWLGVRNHIVDEPRAALRDLIPWTRSRSPYVRRFASEATRPIGVWSRHIPALRRDPSPALPLLSALVSDSERYVRLSVGNWLNDASKSVPAWVLEFCATCIVSPETGHVRERALRTIRRTSQ